MKNFKLSLILPTFDEKENLEIIIPNIVDLFSKKLEIDYEIIVVDDSSKDGTKELIENLNSHNSKVKLMLRNKTPSLPLSIYEGILGAKYENVMWMDADGSMPIEAMYDLIIKFYENTHSAVVGSRFTDGGGYKGITDADNQSFFRAISIVNKSEDSALAMILSIVINKILSFLFKAGLTDLTSGFVIVNKEYIEEDSFSNKVYGEYFIYFISSLISKNIEIVEVGYVCETRLKGYSKTANNIFQIIKRGLPYFYAAWRKRKK
tara:strand:- start:2270 stop:3058 length:789 start_codon:yes stop_codon:yes gene_type:complete